MLALIVLSSSRLYAPKKYIFLDICQNPSNSSIIMVHWNSLEKHYVIRAVASGEARGAAAPLGPVEIDTSSLWMELSSLESVISVILIIVTCNCLPFSYSRSIFRTHLMRSAENSILQPPNLRIFWGRIPPASLQGSCLPYPQ